ncbi:MAG: ABC transporter permease [Bryobacterales bacterium]|nr:ABC transporter permease [Bryobacterales bacterium]
MNVETGTAIRLPATSEKVEEGPVIILQPQGRWPRLRLQDVWEYRDLLYFLVWRDVKVRYKQTVLGAAWAVLQPVLATIVFSIFFGRLAKVPSDGIPYPVFAYVALLPWQLFAFCLGESAHSLVTNQHLIKKVYFPRLVIPLSTVLTGLVDFGVAFIVLLILLFAYGIVPTAASLVLLPPLLLFAIAAALSVGIWLSALNVQFRDVRYTLPFLTQIWMFATPVVYSSHLVPAKWRPLYGLNPMTGVVEGFRWVLLGHAKGGAPQIWVSAGIVVLLLVGGLFYFRRMESTFADIV